MNLIAPRRSLVIVYIIIAFIISRVSLAGLIHFYILPIKRLPSFRQVASFFRELNTFMQGFLIPSQGKQF